MKKTLALLLAAMMLLSLLAGCASEPASTTPSTTPADTTTNAEEALVLADSNLIINMPLQKVYEDHLASGADIRTAMKYGSACGALTTMKRGSLPSLPTREEIEDFLKEHEEV